MPISAAKKKLRIKTQLEREWGKPAYTYANTSDFHYDHASRFVVALRNAGFDAIALGSIR